MLELSTLIINIPGRIIFRFDGYQWKLNVRTSFTSFWIQTNLYRKENISAINQFIWSNNLCDPYRQNWYK